MVDSLNPSDIFNMPAIYAEQKQTYEELKSDRDTAFMILELESELIALTEQDNDIINTTRTTIDYFKTYIGMLEMLVDRYFESCNICISKAEEEIFSEDTRYGNR